LNTRSEEYRVLAAACRDRAKEARIADVQYHFEQVAKHWLRLADEAAELER
jgi:hypothetical protein